jgi:N-acetylglutamate synthase-like GNAT family acetyltransferase
MTAVVVRSARPEDADQLARLFDQLGHQQVVDELHARLESVLADPRADVLVADDAGTLIGAATCFLVPVAHDDRPWCRITTLVVDEDCRSRGIGHMLVEAAERAARDGSCSRIEATSALHRYGAHRFYESLGYGQSSAHFLKRLP